MTMQSRLPTPKNKWLPLVITALLTLFVYVVSITSLVSGVLTIFQNLFYLPIIIACVYYLKWGFAFSVVLACSYFFLMLIFSRDPVVLQGAVIRVLLFILVAGVITYLSIVRIRAEDALRESEEFNRGLVENMPNLVIVYDRNRKIRYVNPTATGILGYTTEEMLGTDIITYVVPHQHAEIAAAMQERFSSGRGMSLEIDLITKEGRHLTVVSSGVPLQFHNQPAVLILLADISNRKRAEDALKRAHDELEHRVAERTRELQQTNEDLRAEIAERKQAEEKLRMSETDLRQAQAVAHVGSWRWDTANDQLAWSDEMYNIYGIAQSAFTGSWQHVTARAVHPDDRARVEESTRAAIEDHNPQVIEYRIVRPDGSVRTVWDETGEMTLDDKGHVSSLTGIILDITNRKLAEAQLRQSYKMEAIGELAGGVAHDFNNLLTGILGNISLMRSTMSPSDPLLENVNAAETAARQAATLTKGLLTFSRGAAVLPVPINPTAALEATLALLKQSLPATVNIVRDYEQTAWNVLMDQSQITQILFNLAVNARDAMRGKGTLTIRTRNEVLGDEHAHVHPSARTGEFVHLSVTDTGPGMSAEVMQHVFEPFYTTKPVGSGTGLGLSIVYGAVEQAGGWITVASTEGVGTTFDIYLPRCLQESAPLLAPASIPLDVGSGTILVVEDEPVVCAVAQALLGKSGYTVLTAPDGASALNALRDHPTDIDLILLDMTMPGMTTDEVVQAIRVLNSTVRILLTSGYTSGDTVNRMLEEGSVQGFLAKPYTLADLVGEVQELLHKS